MTEGVILWRHFFSASTTRINDKRVDRLYALDGLSLRAKLPHHGRAAAGSRGGWLFNARSRRNPKRKPKRPSKKLIDDALNGLSVGVATETVPQSASAAGNLCDDVLFVSRKTCGSRPPKISTRAVRNGDVLPRMRSLVVTDL
jgi:hypothetical protein